MAPRLELIVLRRGTGDGRVVRENAHRGHVAERCRWRLAIGIELRKGKQTVDMFTHSGIGICLVMEAGMWGVNERDAKGKGKVSTSNTLIDVTRAQQPRARRVQLANPNVSTKAHARSMLAPRTRWAVAAQNSHLARQLGGHKSVLNSESPSRCER